MTKRRLALLLASWGGLGYSPAAPGTFGALGAAAVGYGILQVTGLGAWVLAPLAVLLFFPAVWAADEAERSADKHDPGWVVVDEAVGQWLALAAARPLIWPDWVLAFVLFRIFDITKPWPIRRLEKLPGGLGIVGDDAAAGLCAMMILGLCRWLVFAS